MTRLAAAVLLLGSTLLLQVAGATADAGDAVVDPGPYEVGDAHEHFERGVDLYRERSYEAAIAEFSKAYELAPDYRVLFNLAQVQSERHDYVAALKLFKEYLALGGREISEQRRKEVAGMMARLQRRVGILWVQCDAPSGELIVDGVYAGDLPLTTPLSLNAGVHQLQLRRPGSHTVTQVLTIAGGDTVRLLLPATPTPQAGSSGPQAELSGLDGQREPADGREPSSWPGALVWGGLATSAIFTGGAIAFGALASSASETLDRELENIPADRARVADARGDLKRNALLSDVSLVGAVVTAGLTLYWALATADPSESDSERPLSHLGKTRLHALPDGLRFVHRF